MTRLALMTLPALAVETDFSFTLPALARACSIDPVQLLAWIDEGVLTPEAAADGGWRFGADSLARARSAQRLARDLALGAAGLALVLDLLDRIAALDARLAQQRGS